jgi:hypothetical protein
MNQFSLRRKEQNITDLIFRKLCVLTRISSHQDLKNKTQHSRHDRHPTRHQMGKVEASRYVPVLTSHSMGKVVASCYVPILTCHPTGKAVTLCHVLSLTFYQIGKTKTSYQFPSWRVIVLVIRLLRVNVFPFIVFMTIFNAIISDRLKLMK